VNLERCGILFLTTQLKEALEANASYKGSSNAPPNARLVLNAIQIQPKCPIDAISVFQTD
jgi:hypothetical protein